MNGRVRIAFELFCKEYEINPDGKVATITRKEPGDKCALIVKELFANEQTNQSAEA